ncbi:hypothetical protein Adt_18214 [Abeliophyllum distichum]|uniref:Uncharacterized protein n=1 Tax=Abeliophyllum distichum TaxID=126358 RepID=A0ABD1TIQ9_9LAMI
MSASGEITEASPEVFSSIAEVRPLRDVSAITGEELAIVPCIGGGPVVGSSGNGSAREGPSVNGRWAAMDVPLVANEADLENIKRTNLSLCFAYALPRCELKDDGLDILRAIYLQSSKEKRFDSLLKAPRHLVELGQMAKKVDFKQGKKPTPPLVKVMVTKVRKLRPGSSEDSHQKKAIDEETKEPLNKKKKKTPPICPRPSLKGIARGTEDFKKYVNKSWKAFLTEREAEDWMEASLACSIRSAAAQIKSLMVMRKLKKKVANTLEAMSQTNEIKEGLDSTVALVESAKLAYEKARREEILKLKSELEKCQRGKAEVEIVRDSVMVEKEDLANGLEDAEDNFVANFHLTEAYTSFFNYFASVSQQEVITALCSKHPNLDLSSLEAKFPPMDIKDPPEE